MALVTKPKRAASVHHKRRNAQHHKRDGHYLKTYWPYLPLLLIVGVGLVFSSLWGTVSEHVLGYATNVGASGLLDGTNAQRASNGLSGLTINQQLNQAAQAKANDMTSRNYWSHNTPEGSEPWGFVTSAGYQYQSAGENLAYGFDSSDETITAWMNSPGHRANILNSGYKEVGFGFAESADYQGTGPETVIVAMYGTPVSVAAAPVAPVAKPSQLATPAPTPAPSPAPAQEKATEPETNTTPVATEDTAKKPQAVEASNVSRIQVLTNGDAPWSMFAISALATICAIVFIWRHGLFWHRALVKGEAFVVKHKFLDIALVLVGVLGFVLTRSAGVIH